MTVRSITQVLCDPVKEADMTERLENDPDWRCISIGTTLVIFEHRKEWKEISSSQYKEKKEVDNASNKYTNAT